MLAESENQTTRERTKTVAVELARQGIQPTPTEVRDRLGTGSMTTITAALKEWWKNEVPQRFAANSMAPANWDQPLIDAVDKLMSIARIAEGQRFEEDRQQFHLLMSGLRDELAQAEQARQDTIQLLTVESQQRKAAEHMSATLREALEHERVAAEQGRADREQLVDDLDKLQRQFEAATAKFAEETAQLRAAHAHELEKREAAHLLATQTVREDSARREQLAYDRFEGARAQLMEETSRLRDEFKESKTQLEDQLRSQQVESREREDQLRRKAALADRAEAEARGELKALRSQIQQLEDALERLRQEQQEREGSATVKSMDDAASYCRQRIAEDVPAFDITAELQEDFGLTRAEADEMVRTCLSTPPSQ